MRVSFDWPHCLLCNGKPPEPGNVLHVFLDTRAYPGYDAPLEATLQEVEPKIFPGGVHGYHFSAEIPDEQMPRFRGQIVSVLTCDSIAYIDCVDCCEILAKRLDDLEDNLGEFQTIRVIDPASVQFDCAAQLLRFNSQVISFRGTIGITKTWSTALCPSSYGYGGYPGGDGGQGGSPPPDEGPTPGGEPDLNPE